MADKRTELDTYHVTYVDGRERDLQLSPEDAKALGDGGAKVDKVK